MNSTDLFFFRKSKIIETLCVCVCGQWANCVSKLIALADPETTTAYYLKSSLPPHLAWEEGRWSPNSRVDSESRQAGGGSRFAIANLLNPVSERPV